MLALHEFSERYSLFDIRVILIFGGQVMSEDSKVGFQVVDKRQFDENGQPRVDACAVEQFDRAQDDKKHKPVSSTEGEHGSAPIELDFSGFVLGMMHQAVIMLGEAPHPDTGEVIENIEIAKQTIEILAMLEQKTKGNLTTDEDKLLHDGLTGLRMAYVAKVREKQVEKQAKK